MKQVAQNYRSGELTVLDVPPPTLRPGGVLVRSLYSLISTGTEVMKVKEARLSLAGKARARPEQVRQVVDTVAQQGPMAAYKKVMTKLDSYTPLGYSLCGVVEQVGKGAEEFTVGQLVACAGNEHALHAEVNWVPTNLCVAVPDGVEPQLAAFATVGAIAMHGVRRCEAQLGDTACVVGLGLVGQLAVQLLVAAGVRVVGLDVVEERCKMAERSGAIGCTSPDPEGIDRIAKRSRRDDRWARCRPHPFGGRRQLERPGRGRCDARTGPGDRGRHRQDQARPALERVLREGARRSLLALVRTGPLRRPYELEGIDYPAGYVRWTERRNLACFIDLLARGELDLSSLVSGTFPVEQAVDVYDRLSSGDLHGVGFLFEYPPAPEGQKASSAQPEKDASQNGHATLIASRAPRRPGATVGVGFVGAGNYASSMLLPHLVGQARDRASPRRHQQVSQRTRRQEEVRFHRGQHRRRGRPRRRLGRRGVRRDSSPLSRRAHLPRTSVRAKPCSWRSRWLCPKSSFPRCSTRSTTTGNDRLMVGFNRRFAPMLTEMRSRFGSAPAGGVARYAVNAGPLGARSWYNDTKLEGSRFEGEGGHFIDTLSWWFDALPTEVFAIGGQGSSRHSGEHAGSATSRSRSSRT